MNAKTLRAMVDSREPKLGTLVWEFATPGIGHLVAAAGAEFVFFDTEHSALGIGELKQCLRYFEAANVPVLVRPPGKTYPHIANALDAGAEGLVLPMVASADEARDIVASAKYPPRGRRGVALTVAHDRYTDGPVRAKLDAADRRTVLFALVETADGARNVDAIAEVEGIDGLWIGHLDLSASLGCAGEFEHPDYVHAVERIENAARSNGLALGRVVGTPQEGRERIAAGYDFVGIGTDTQIYLEALRAGLAAMSD